MKSPPWRAYGGYARWIVQGKEAVNANLLASLNDEYPASRHTTAWVLDEFGVPTRRVGGNIGDDATQELDKR
jgi:hypothetical protein